MIINNIMVCYMLVFLATFTGLYLSKTPKYIQIQRLMMFFLDFFIHIMNFSSRSKLSLTLSMTGVTESSDFRLANIAAVLKILPS